MKRGEQFSLFDAAPYTLNPKRDYHPDRWEGSVSEHTEEGINYHATHGPRLPGERGRYGASVDAGFHVGTEKAALERNDRSFVVPVELREDTVQYPDEREDHRYARTGMATHKRVYSDQFANDYDSEWTSADQAHLDRFGTTWSDNVSDGVEDTSRASRMVTTGKTIPYLNISEDEGSISYRAPRQNLKTWRDSVLEDDQAPPRYKRVAEAGYNLVRHIDPATPIAHHQDTLEFEGPSPEGSGVGPFRYTYDGHWKTILHPRKLDTMGEAVFRKG